MFYYIDTFFISFYRISPIPIVGYLIGTFFLAFCCVVVGEFTYSISWWLNRGLLNKDGREMIRMHNLSFTALSVKDKPSYKACNHEANEAFGKYFFLQIAIGLASLWPAPFALAWMGTRFSAVDFRLPFELPGIGHSVGYAASFIPIYILTYMLFSRLKVHLPYFKTMKRQIEADASASEEMMTLADLIDETPSAPQVIANESQA